MLCLSREFSFLSDSSRTFRASVSILRTVISEKKASIVPLSARYTISGTLRKSQIYTATHSQQRFLVIDKSGKIISYALPANDYAKENALSLINKKVGIRGLITKDPDNSVTVIKFTEIEDISKE